MIGLVFSCAALVGLAVLLFAASIRLGMLLGFRLDRVVEARVSAGNEETAETSRGAAGGAMDGVSGPEE